MFTFTNNYIIGYCNGGQKLINSRYILISEENTYFASWILLFLVISEVNLYLNSILYIYVKK